MIFYHGLEIYIHIYNKEGHVHWVEKYYSPAHAVSAS